MFRILEKKELLTPLARSFRVGLRVRAELNSYQIFLDSNCPTNFFTNSRHGTDRYSAMVYRLLNITRPHRGAANHLEGEGIWRERIIGVSCGVIFANCYQLLVII
jgi:hypothetical protein